MTARDPEQLAILNCGTMNLNQSRVISGVNSALTGWIGRTEEELADQDLRVLLARGSLVYWEATVEPLLENQGFAWDVSLELESSSGQKVAVLMNARRTMEGTNCLFFPFSERRQYESQLRAAHVHARRQKDEITRLEELRHFRRDFVNAAAHELATPMTPLQIKFHLLKTMLQEEQNPRVQQALESMEANLDKLAKFSSALIQSANIDAGRIGMSVRSVDAGLAVPKMIDAWRSRHGRHREITIESEPAFMEADLKALRVCVNNLLENALKFSSAATPIHVRISGGEFVCISVEDQGRGIDPDRIRELGRPFVQLHESREVTELGAGLGLHIVSGLMKAQSGRMLISSPGRGQGTTATLQFPLAATVPAT